MCIENYFSRYRELIFWPKCVAGLAVEGDLFECLTSLATIRKLCKRSSAFKGNAKAKHCQGKKRKKFSSFLTKSERSQ